MLWSEKTTVCRIFNCQRSGLPGISRQSVYVGHRSERHSRPAFALTRFGGQAALKRSVPTSVQEKPEGLITPPKLFKERVILRRLQPGPGLPAATPQGAKAGGEYRARTGDLLVANQALSQLS
jgi:hypothetical protein